MRSLPVQPGPPEARLSRDCQGAVTVRRIFRVPFLDSRGSVS
jgi:hypothetical protein